MFETISQGERDPAEETERTETEKSVTYDIPNNSQEVVAARKADEARIAHILEKINALPDFARTEKGGKLAEVKAQEITIEGVENLLLATEAINVQLDKEVSLRYGEGFYESLRVLMSGWVESFLKKGDDAVNWVEAKGLPLPKSKAGLRMLSGVIGVAGIAPGMGVLWPLAYVLWKRGGNIGSAINSNIESATKYV